MSELIFGPFTLDRAATRLLRDGRDVKLRPQGLAALRVLLKHGGETVRYEQMIQEALERMAEGRTILVIAHRFSTLKNADRLIVLDKGKVVEIGTQVLI